MFFLIVSTLSLLTAEGTKPHVCATKPRVYAVQHIPVPVPSQDKLEGLQQEGHPV